MSEVDELIERLRKGRLSYMLDSGAVYHGGDDLHIEAADALATLTARAEAAEARLAKAVEALRPFAVTGGIIPAFMAEGAPISVAALHFRRARAALIELEE